MRCILRPLALAVGLLTAMPALAADPELSEKDKVDKILRELHAMKSSLEEVRTMSVQLQQTAKEVRDLQRRMEELEQAFAKLSAARTQVRNYPAEPAASSATIRIQNRYSVPATVTINDRTIAVPAYQSRLVNDMPAGAFTYEVQAEGFGVIQPAVRRTVDPNETFTIFINPPAQPAPQVLLVP
jgi:hypothetical protein